MGDLFANLGIDPKLLFAQAANFLLVLFVLQKFVFKRVFKFLDERQKNIQEGVNMRASAVREVERAKSARHQELEKAKQEVDVLLSTARSGAAQREREALAGARVLAENMLKKAKEEAARAEKDALAKAQKEIQMRALFFAEKTLSRSMTQEDEKLLLKEMKEFAQNHV
ncbi:MAG: ATP synthase F0 subunit B [Candidatus Wildermuthbacteria bacterium]|nr:ATP synthase F0 subunit B [Candidatus Wildermuthbacteria bacterium]